MDASADDTFGIEVILSEGDKKAPCCPHGKIKYRTTVVKRITPNCVRKSSISK